LPSLSACRSRSTHRPYFPRGSHVLHCNGVTSQRNALRVLRRPWIWIYSRWMHRCHVRAWHHVELRR